MTPLALAPSHRRRPIDSIRIAAPCSMGWDDMRGDDKRRFCGQCNKHVYNFIAMSEDEIAELIAETEGRFCGRLYRRKDGTILTADCPVGLAERAWRRARNTALLSASLVVTLLAGSWGLFFGRSQRIEAVQQRIEQVRIEVTEREQPMAGGIKALPPDVEELLGEPAPFEMGDIAVPQAPAPDVVHEYIEVE